MLKLSDIATQSGQLSKVPRKAYCHCQRPTMTSRRWLLAKCSTGRCWTESIHRSMASPLSGFPARRHRKTEQQLVERFLSGLEKLLSKDNNWAFLKQLAAVTRSLRPLPNLRRSLPYLQRAAAMTRCTARRSVAKSFAAW